MDDSTQRDSAKLPPASYGNNESSHDEVSCDTSRHQNGESLPARDTDSDIDMEDVVVTEGPTRADVKKKHHLQNQRKEVIDVCKTLLSTVLNNEHIWVEPDMDFLRDFVSAVNNDRQRFPAALPPEEDAEEAESMEKSTPCLDKDFVSQIYSRKVCSQEDGQPVGLVTACSSQYKEIHVYGYGRTNQQKIFTLHLADGNGNIVTAKVASQLNSLMHRVKPGSVLRLLRYNAVPFKQSESAAAQLRIALILCNFEICGRMEIPVSLRSPPPPQRTP